MAKRLRACARCKELKPLKDFYDPPTSYCRVCSRRAVLEWRAKYPGRRAAHKAVDGALLGGILVRPNICEKCGEHTYTCAHHEDYTKPLEVMWLCDSCHGKRHVELRRSRPKPCIPKDE